MPKSKKMCEISKPEKKYQVQLDSLQVRQANRDNNVEKAVEVLEQKSRNKKSIEFEVVRKKKTNGTTVVSPQEKVTAKEVEVIEVEQSSAQSKELVKMTPAELELLIDKIMEETHPSKKERESFYGSRATQ
jgi:hypothetical protein